MKRISSVLGWITALIILCALNAPAAWAQPTITPEVLATNVGGLETGTDNTQFIFRATITATNGVVNTGNNRPRVVIDPFDPANPEFGGAVTFFMTQKTATLWVAYVAGSAMNGGSGNRNGSHQWSILAQEFGSTGGTLMNGTGANPKSGNLQVVPNANSFPPSVSVLPVDANGQPDKRLIPGQLGGGLRVDPVDTTAPQDGGSSHFYTWRVRITTTGGLPPQLFSRRSLSEWRDPRGAYDTAPPLIDRYHSPVILWLIGPDGITRPCHMEIAAGQAVNYAGTYTHDAQNPDTLLHPTGNAVWSNQGIVWEYRMLPTQYQFNWGSQPGEGPVTAFGGPTAPDALPAIPIGYQIGPEVIGRPFANEYVAFAGADRLKNLPFGPLPPPFPFYTDTAFRAGQWKYYYQVTTDLRPITGPTNGNINTYPNDPFGANPGAYASVFDSDNGGGPSSPATPYNHPFVTPLLSDGGWTDDIPENGYASGTGSNSHRSRPTTKTRVRFQVRVTKADNSPLPASAVRIFIDGTPFTMTQLPVAGNNDFQRGIVYFYDTTFPEGKQGQHWIYFQADDGSISGRNHVAIWPRRDTAVNGTGEAVYFDPQAALAPYANTFNNPVSFGTGIVGKNYLTEPLVNNRPVLSNPIVTPPSGSEGAPFTYEVTYTDGDNDQPLDADVVIDGIAHRMTENPADSGKPYSQGRRFQFTMTLNQTPDAKHSYFFRFRDNWNKLQPYGVSDLRREFGEWATLPLGDDNGVPAFEISGPTIISNHPSELTDAQYFGSDQANTPATLYDFIVKYKDADNQAPANVRVYISSDGGNTFDGGTALSPAENSTNYVAGVLYHLATRKSLPVGGPYVFRFQANDGVQPVDSTLVHVGNRDKAVQDNTAHELKLLPSSNVTYGDPNLTANPNSTKNWLDTAGTYYLWTKNGSTYTPLVAGVDYTVDFANGTVTLVAPTPLKVFASYFYRDTVGPLVTPNRAPLLSVPDPGNAVTNEGTLTPLQGSPTTPFTFSILYSDPDNQPPTFGAGTTGVNVVIDTTNTIQMTMDPATPTPIDWRKPVKFTATTTLQVGGHSYHFETSDGADVGRYPLSTANPTELDGPTVTDPTNLQTPLIQPFPKGKSTDNYVFTVTYKNPQGNAPPQGGIEVRLIPQGGGQTITALMSPIDPIGGPQFQAGVRYQVQLSGTSTPPLPAGTYSVVFGFVNSPTSGTAPLTLTVNGRPVLSSPSATPNPASQAGDITFSVTYTDINGDPPQRPAGGASTIKLFIDGVASTITPTTLGTDFKAGVVYQWTYQAKDIPVGDHQFYFSAQDDLEDANPLNVPAPPGSTFTIKTAQVPVLSAPGGDASNNNGTLTPLSGSKNATYTYSVVYKHGDGVAPSTINVVIDPAAANPRTVALTPLTPNPTAAQLIAGVTYSVSLSDLASGAHTYKFTATDRLAGGSIPGHSVELPIPPAAPFNGPTVNFVPTLTNGIAYVAGAATKPTVNAQNQLTPPVKGNVLSKFVFEVMYTDQDNVAPSPAGTVKVVINGTQEIILKPKPGSALNYAAGVVYSTEADSPGGVTLTAGQKVFHFDASDGVDASRLPAAPGTDISGLTVANVPTLEKINPTGDDGTLSPRTGPISQTFTYKVIYKNADNTPPAYVHVIIDGVTYDMAKVTATANNFSAGVAYQYQHRFPQTTGSNHTYRFEAEDTVSPGQIAKYPVDGSVINGPAINVPVFIQPTITPLPGQIGSEVTITSQLQTNSPLGVPIIVTLVRPDGSGETQTVNTDPATGNFIVKFTPAQTGDWKARFSWDGVAGTFDPLTTEFPFKVAGFKLSLAGGVLDMVSSPLVPTTPDPSLTLSPTTPGGAPLPVTDVNAIKWLPQSGRYAMLNQDADFPGMSGGQAFWVRPTQALDLNPRGRLWDQTQPYSIPLFNGWNQIGSVYLQPINWGGVQVRSNGQLIPISQASNLVRPIAWTYNKATGSYDPVDVPSGMLNTGRGYWVRALQSNVELVLNPPGTRSAPDGRAAIDPTTSLQVAVRAGSRMESGNYVPLKGEDKTRFVELMEKPPYVSNYVTVKFIDASKVELPANSRAAATGSSIVAFEVVTDQKNTDVTLQFPNASTMGRKTDVTLIDLASGTQRAIGTSSGITYNSGENAAPRRYALIIKAVTSADRLIISELRVAETGGRASGVFRANYNITGAASIKAQIVGANGLVVRELDKGRAATRGVNTLSWDGKDSRGVSVPSGNYTLKLSATDEKGGAANAVVPILIVR